MRERCERSATEVRRAASSAGRNRGVRSRPKCARQAREHTSARSGRWDPRTRLGRASEVGPDEYWPWAVGCAHAPAGHTAGGSLGTCGSGEEQLTEQWRTFRSLPSRSQTGLACIHVSSHSACEPPSCACIAPPSYPSSLIVSANPCLHHRDARGGRGFGDAPLVTYELGSRAWWLLLVGLQARCYCRSWSGRCCGHRGAASR